MLFYKEKNMKKSLFVVLVICLAFTACSKSSSSSSGSAPAAAATSAVPAPIVIRLPTDVAIDSNKAEVVRSFKSYVEDKSGGRISVEVYYSSVLGGPNEYTESLIEGSVQMAAIGTELAQRAPATAVFELPFLFSDWEQVKKVVASDFGKNFYNDFPAKYGLRATGYLPLGFRVVMSNKALAKMDDFRRLRLRVPQIELYITLGTSFGASPISMALAELYTGLEQGAVDGLELPYAYLTANKYYEVLKHVLITNHIFAMHNLYINEKFYQSLSPDLQQIIMDGGRHMQEIAFQLTEQSEKDVVEELKKEGVAIITPDANYRKQLVDAQQDTVKVFFRLYPDTEEPISQIRKIINQ